MIGSRLDWQHMGAKTQRCARLLLALGSGLLLSQPLGAQQAKAPAAPEAGRVLMAIGEVKAVRNGATIVLAKNAPVQSGDTIITGIASNAQLRMSDGAVLALRAQTEFKIDEYRFNGKADGTEKAVLSLVKGGVRAVTGTIGHDNKDNLQVNAVVATVGIRGTGFNLNYCQANCVNPDKTLASDGLYAGVFEGQITVKNEVAKDTLGVNEYLYVADKNAQPKQLLQPPSFLPDPLSGQKVAKGSKQSSGDIPTLSSGVNPPTKPADRQVAPAADPLPTVDGVVVNVPPVVAQQGGFFTPTTVFNSTTQGDGSAPPTGSSGLAMQRAEVWPQGAVGADGLPQHNVGQLSNVTVTGTSSGVTQILQPATSNNYQNNSAQQMEVGNYAGIVSWGRWANGNVTVGTYNSGQPYALASDNGFHYIVGQTVPTPGAGSYTFNLVGATTPTSVLGGQSWAVTSGTLTANVGGSGGIGINGNLGLYTNQSGGYAVMNMNYSGSGSNGANIPVSVNVVKTGGSLNACASGCAGSGNVGLYGTGNVPKAAGLGYQFNTGSAVVQGVAVYK